MYFTYIHILFYTHTAEWEGQTNEAIPQIREKMRKAESKLLQRLPFLKKKKSTVLQNEVSMHFPTSSFALLCSPALLINCPLIVTYLKNKVKLQLTSWSRITVFFKTIPPEYWLPYFLQAIVKQSIKHILLSTDFTTAVSSLVAYTIPLQALC